MTDEERLAAVQEILDDIPGVECQDTEFSCGWKGATHSIQHIMASDRDVTKS